MTDREAMKLAFEALDQYIEKELTVGQRYTNEGQQLLDAHAILRQALQQPEQVSVPDGWTLVPIEPTDAMLSVPVNIDLRECVTPGGVTGLDAVGLFRAWEAMIEAAPQPWDTSDMAHRAGGLSMEQEPVAWRQSNGIIEPVYGVTIPIGSPLYAAPPKREWVGLTDEEREYLWGITPIEDEDRFAFVLAVEAKLKEKNHGNAKG